MEVGQDLARGNKLVTALSRAAWYGSTTAKKSSSVLDSLQSLLLTSSYVFDDGRRMVGEAADVQRGGVGLHVGQSPVVLIHLIYLLAELLSEAVEIC